MTLILFALLSVFFGASSAYAKTYVVVGGGPSGIAVVDGLSQAGHSVVLIEANPYVGGNVAHGYFYSKEYSSLLEQYRSVLSRSNVRFFGGVKIGEDQAIQFAELAKLPMDGLIFTHGAKNKTLQIPNEDRALNFSDVVYYSNGHPDYPKPPTIGKVVIIIGSGSSAHDTIRYLREQRLGIHFVQLVRGGPGQIGTKWGTLGQIAELIHFDAYRTMLSRIEPKLTEVGETMDMYLNRFGKELKGKPPGESSPGGTAEILYLVSPTQVLLDDQGRVSGVEVTQNHLVSRDGRMEPESIGKRFVVYGDTVIKSIGGTANPDTGLPLFNERVKTKDLEDFRIKKDSDLPNPSPYFATRTLKHYEVDFSESIQKPPFPVFVAGWARLPGIGATEETNRFSNTPDGRTLAKLLVEEASQPPIASDLETVTTAINSILSAKDCRFILTAESKPAKRPSL